MSPPGNVPGRKRTVRAQLAVEIDRIVDNRGLTQAAVANLLGVRQPHVSDLANYRLNRLSVGRSDQRYRICGAGFQPAGPRPGKPGPTGDRVVPHPPEGDRAFRWKPVAYFRTVI
ncbi:MAG: XRE family transcriptional regulator [Gammaproteobacteria bacterium]|nr:XRE family transcriptional regulator [Gammaproteobacteria bacterium]